MLVITNNGKVLDTELDSFMWDDDTNVAFIKIDCTSGTGKWLILSASGEKIAEVDSQEQAFIIARQNDLKPFSAH